MDKITSGPNWEEILGGEFEKRAKDQNFENMTAMEKSAASLPSGFDYAWTGLSYQQRVSASQAPLLYAVSIIVVFLCLAALYESWTIPLAVLLAVPTGIVGALGGVYLRGMPPNLLRHL